MNLTQTYESEKLFFEYKKQCFSTTYLSEIKFRGDLFSRDYFSRGFIFADDELGFFRGVLFSRIDYVQTFRVDKFSRMSKSKIQES